jgi:hypothetical protein
VSVVAGFRHHERREALKEFEINSHENRTAILRTGKHKDSQWDLIERKIKLNSHENVKKIGVISCESVSN